MSDGDDVVAEMDAELALIEPLPYRVPIHLLAKRARDEIVALRKALDRVVRADMALSRDAAQTVRAEALADCVRICPECANRIKALNTVGANHLRGKLP